MSPRKAKKFSAFHWHRRVGLMVLVLVILLAITGLLLNHTERFGFDARYVQSAWLLDWYGLEPEGEPQSYAAGEHHLSQWQQPVYFGRQQLTHSQQTLRGAVRAGPLIVAAFDHELLLISAQGELVERMTTAFGKNSRLGLWRQRAVIATEDGQYYAADENIIDWQPVSGEDVVWSQPVPLSDTEREALRQQFRGNGLSLERVLLDLHSGRLFGRYGVYLMDAAAIAMLWLSFSGLWVWWRRQHKQQQKTRKKQPPRRAAHAEKT